MATLVYDSISEEFQSTFGPKALPPPQREYFRRLIRLTALLHDLGHGPFSHSIEGVANAGRSIHPLRKVLFEEGSIPHHWIDEKVMSGKGTWLDSPSLHEEFTVDVLAKMADRNGMIAGVAAQDIAALSCDWVVPTPEFLEMNRVGPSGKWSLRFALKSIVSGELDADRMDYLLRDSLYTGVPYGQYDKDMLVDNMLWRPLPGKGNQLGICIRRKALHAFEDFLLARFHMFMQLYSHKTTVAFDVVLENALAELPDFDIKPNLEEYLTWSDDWLLRKILENRSSRWGEHIRDRKTLKHLFTVRQEDQEEFRKFISPYERSVGTTAWFPSLKNKLSPKQTTGGKKGEVPKLWWRHCVSFLTREARGRYPLYLEDRRQLIPVEQVSLLLSSDFVRRLDFMHVYCLREDEQKVVAWLIQAGVPESILAKPRSLVT